MTENPWRPGPRHREPAELGKPIVEPAAWYPADLAGSEEWMYRLSDAEVGEIHGAVDRIQSERPSDDRRHQGRF